MKFLIVDDSQQDLLATERYLIQEFGDDSEISRASSPEEALDILKDQAFDCVLLDLHHHTSSGYHIVKTLKNENSDMPSGIVVMTGCGVEYALNSFQLCQQLRNRRDDLERINHELKHKDKLKTHFVASASHELRTPVTAMLGLLEMLEETALDCQQKQLLADLRACGDSLLLTVDDIIDLARIEAGIMETRPLRFHLVNEIQESLRSLRVLARDKNLTLESHIPECLQPWRLGDRRRIRQILNNLVGNAVKYTERGRIDVTISEGEGDRLKFSVADSGIGIAPEDQKRIFEPFYQADDEHGSISSGLGLATCLNLVRALEGELRLESEPGKGSIFSFTIPLPTVEPPTCREKCKCKEEGILKDNNHKHLHILLAEDNQIIANILQAQLESRDYTVYLASDGAEALEILKTEKIDVVLMDCQMPNMDGYEATENIRSQLKLELPVIALTADAFQSQRDRCLESGMNDILVKPVSVDDLDTYLSNLRIKP